jgi:hypothetical protein
MALIEKAKPAAYCMQTNGTKQIFLWNSFVLKRVINNNPNGEGINAICSN